jgi:hypothetical protein
LIALILVVGIAAGAVFTTLGSLTEATTLIVDREESIPAREFGVVGQAVFRSDAALRPAMVELGVSTSAEQFLADSVELRPVPDARVLIVVGRASTSTRAREVSATMADALVAALADAGVEGLVVLTGGIEGRSLAPSVVVALGGFTGLWLGLGTAIALYHFRRPVLSLPRAMRLVSPTRVVLLDGRASWLGSLRGQHRLRKGARNELALSRLAAQEGNAPVVISSAAHRRRRLLSRRLAKELRASLGAVDGSPRKRSSHLAEETIATRLLDEDRTIMLVANAGTRETELVLDELLSGRGKVDLLWIR